MKNLTLKDFRYMTRGLSGDTEIRCVTIKDDEGFADVNIADMGVDDHKILPGVKEIYLFPELVSGHFSYEKMEEADGDNTEQ